MCHFSVNRFTPLSKRLMMILPLYLIALILLKRGNEVEAVVANCGSTSPFGYGRCSDHASKDIRTGYMKREEGVKMVKKYDHVVSSDLDYWLDYVGMKENEFWEIADTFRSEKVWWIKNNEWYKENLWGTNSSYGEVRLKKNLQKKYIRD